MTRRRTRAAAVAALALAGTVALGACGANGTPAGNAGTASRPPTAPAGTPTAPASSTAPTPAGPTSGWGPSIWSGQRGPGMMGGGWGTWGPGMMGGGWGTWGPGMMGNGMMGNWWLAGNGSRVQTLDQARGRTTAFADRLGLQVGEVMQFSRNFYAELQTTNGHPATEVLVNPADGAVQIEYGPAMMWNTTYGMHYGGQRQTTVSAAQAKSIANSWLRASGSTLTAGNPESYPGYYTLHTMQNDKIVGMLSVNATTGQVWDHTWHGTYIATSQATSQR